MPRVPLFDEKSTGRNSVDSDTQAEREAVPGEVFEVCDKYSTDFLEQTAFKVKDNSLVSFAQKKSVFLSF